MPALAVLLLLLLSLPAPAWEKKGIIPGTELEFSELGVSKSGVSVRLTNPSQTAVKVSIRLAFFDERGNSLGYTVFALREIAGGSYVNIADNFLNGSWKKCRDAYRSEWQPMTYELVY